MNHPGVGYWALGQCQLWVCSRFIRWGILVCKQQYRKIVSTLIPNSHVIKAVYVLNSWVLVSRILPNDPSPVISPNPKHTIPKRDPQRPRAFPFSKLFKFVLPACCCKMHGKMKSIERSNCSLQDPLQHSGNCYEREVGQRHNTAMLQWKAITEECYWVVWVDISFPTNYCT